MSWQTVVREVEVESSVCALAANLDESQAFALDTILEACETIEPLYEVREDRSPVLAGAGTYLARLDQKRRRIELNAFALERSEAPGALRKFLIFHELFHAWVQDLGQTELWAGFGLREENAADLLALYALQKTGS
jgi:hypothetical protein